jgi:hypothetical protein
MRILAADLKPHDDRHVRELCVPAGWSAERVFDNSKLTAMSFYRLKGQLSEIPDGDGEHSGVEIRIDPEGLTQYTVTLYTVRAEADGTFIKPPYQEACHEGVAPGELQDLVTELLQEGVR